VYSLNKNNGSLNYHYMSNDWPTEVIGRLWDGFPLQVTYIKRNLRIGVHSCSA